VHSDGTVWLESHLRLTFWFLDQERPIVASWGSKSMEFPHWLMIGGALLVFVGLVGSALQRRRPAADPSSLDQGEVTELPKFLK